MPADLVRGEFHMGSAYETNHRDIQIDPEERWRCSVRFRAASASTSLTVAETLGPTEDVAMERAEQLVAHLNAPAFTAEQLKIIHRCVYNDALGADAGEVSAILSAILERLARS